jgi:hypothetical protein
MSLQDAQDFINQANQDAVIRKLASERFGEIETVGREYGFDFARDEFDQAMRERKATQGPQGPRVANADSEGGPTGQACQCGGDADYSGPTGQACQCGADDLTGGPSGTACQCGGGYEEGESDTACTGSACQCGS